MTQIPLRNRGDSLRRAFGDATDLASTAPNGAASRQRRPTPVSLRLTEAERARLERDAAGRSLSAHIRERLFGQAAAPRQGRNRAPVKDHHALARVLSQLGRTGLAKDFETLADAADDGILRLTPETEAAIRQACTDIAAIRRDLIAALGLKPE